MLQEGFGREDDLPLFVAIDRISATAEATVVAHSDFDEREERAVAHDEIDFSSSGTIVPND